MEELAAFVKQHPELQETYDKWLEGYEKSKSWYKTGARSTTLWLVKEVLEDEADDKVARVKQLITRHRR